MCAWAHSLPHEGATASRVASARRFMMGRRSPLVPCLHYLRRSASSRCSIAHSAGVDQGPKAAKAMGWLIAELSV